MCCGDQALGSGERGALVLGVERLAPRDREDLCWGDLGLAGVSDLGLALGVLDLGLYLT